MKPGVLTITHRYMQPGAIWVPDQGREIERECVCPDFKVVLFSTAHEKIWNKLSDGTISISVHSIHSSHTYINKNRLGEIFSRYSLFIFSKFIWCWDKYSAAIFHVECCRADFFFRFVVIFVAKNQGSQCRKKIGRKKRMSENTGVYNWPRMNEQRRQKSMWLSLCPGNV